MISEVLESFWTHSWMDDLKGALYLQEEGAQTFIPRIVPQGPPPCPSLRLLTCC